jgi:hypothetical protein
MNRTRTLLSILGLTLAGAMLLARGRKNPAPRVTSASSTQANRTPDFNPPRMSGQARLIESYGKLPLSFEANRGQTDSQVKFLSRGRGYVLFLSVSEAVLSLRSQKRPVAQHSFPAAFPPQKTTADQSAQFAALSALLEKPQGLRAQPALQEDTPAGDVLHLKLVGANQKPKVVGVDELPGKSNYFIGSDPTQWRTNVPNYAKVRYKDVYPGVDLVYYGNQRQLEYDFVVAPGADPNAISLAIAAMPALGEVKGSSSPRGMPPLQIDAEGDLLIKADSGEIRFHRPVVYQEQESGVRRQESEGRGTTHHGVRKTDASDRQSSIGNRQFLDGRYILSADNRIHFEISKYDKTRPLVIDPVLAYSTYLGGSGADEGHAIAVDFSGNAYVTGITVSTDFPTMNPIQAANAGGGDAFVTKLNAAGSALVYSTFLGGSGFERGQGIAVDSSGNAYVAGITFSTDFPTMNPIQPALAGGQEAFVTKLNAAGSALVYSTYLGGSSDDVGTGIAVDSSGNAYVAGVTFSTDFPTVNALQSTCGGCSSGLPDAFVTKLNAAGSALLYSTFLGGSGFDNGHGIAVDSSGNVYVTGQTVSTDFPTVNPIQAANAGAGDAFVTKLNAAGSALVYSTFLGGSNTEIPLGIAVDSSGNAYVTGQTLSTDFPTMNPFQAANAGGSDAFVTKLNAAGSVLVYSTYLGGSRGDAAFGIAVDSSGNAYVTGITNASGAAASDDFPTVNALQATCGGCSIGFTDAFVTKLNAAGSALVYSTYLGGSEDEIAFGIAVDSSGSAYVTGLTHSIDFPTGDPLQATCGGCPLFSDAFVAKISPPVALSPQSLAFSGQVVGTTSNAQTVSLTNFSGATLTISSLSASGDFAVASTGTTCSASSPVPAGSSCQINVTFTPTASSSRTGTLTVSDSDPTSPQTAALTGIGEDFGVGVAPGTSSSATVSPGGTATYTISVSPLGGFDQGVTMSCMGAPSLSTCTPSVPSVTLDGTNTQNVTFTVTTKGATLSALRARSFPPFALSLLMPLLAFAVVGARRCALSRPALLALALALASLTYLAACSSGSSNSGTATGTYTLTISGTSGSLSHSTPVTLKVQ